MRLQARTVLSVVEQLFGHSALRAWVSWLVVPVAVTRGS